MAIIKPISELRNKSNEISKLVNESHEPVFITKNGDGNMVLMSIPQYRQMEMKLELYKKLSVAEMQVADGDKGKGYRAVIKSIKKKLGEKK